VAIVASSSTVDSKRILLLEREWSNAFSSLQQILT